MSKRVFLISNAHLDPIWQWRWDEGAAEALSTFRTAAELCEESDDFVFNHNEALLYRWIEEYEPALFERIRALVREGRWHIMGGWHLQPDCNMPCGEAFVRQILSGRAYFAEKFGVRPTIAVNLDPFGHTRGLVQILRKSGYTGYLFMRPGRDHLSLPDNAFEWVGYDGSVITARRSGGYASALGQAAQKIRGAAEDCAPDDIALCLWGVGNHGGGPSRKDLQDIAALQTELSDSVQLLHATPEQYFDAVRQSGRTLPRYAGDLNRWAVGCYTSMAQVKKAYRTLESQYFLTEQTACQASAQGLIAYPAAELDAAMYDLLTLQFHDVLPGTSIQPAEEDALRMAAHGTEILSRIRTRTFFALSGGRTTTREDTIPILLYNPYPYPIEGDFACEMMLWDQNRDGDFSAPQVYDGDTPLPTQCEKEDSNLNLDWRKRVVFHTALAPMQMHFFDCAYTRIPHRPKPAARETADALILENGNVCARISKATGMLESYVVRGTQMLSAPLSLHLMRDDTDPWGMEVQAFPDKLDTFRRMSAQETMAYYGTNAPLSPVRCVESGDVRTTVEAALCCARSRIVARYTLSASDNALQVDLRVHWSEVQRMLKLGVPTALRQARCRGGVAYGEQTFAQDGCENCMQQYVRMENDTSALAVCTDSVYGFSASVI